jgi:TatD DNase family protein
MGKEVKPICLYYATTEGCKKGKDCQFAHTDRKPSKSVNKEFKMVVSPVPIVDIGINLTHKRFQSDMKDLIKRAYDNNVTRLIITGTSEVHSKLALELIGKHKDSPCQLYFTAGVHPHEARDCNKDTIQNLEKLAFDPNCVAIGECGLDFDRKFSTIEDQEYWFEEQVKLAVKLKKPLFLHERSAHKSFVKILSKYKEVKACVHCFTGTIEELDVYNSLGYYIGITGCVNKEDERGMALAKIVKHIPLNRLMIET